MPEPSTRSAIVTAAAHLLRGSGARAVTTRAVAQEAGVPTPTIFRLFGDKDGLLDAVAEQVMADYVTTKTALAATEQGDPVADLRAAWRAHIEFGLANPDVFLLLIDPERLRRSPAVTGGAEVLRARVNRVAAAGLLAVSAERAAELIHAAGTGAVLSLLGRPAESRDPELAEAMLAAVLGTVLTATPAPPSTEPVALAVAFQAALPELPALTGAERSLLAEWLGRATAELQRRQATSPL